MLGSLFTLAFVLIFQFFLVQGKCPCEEAPLEDRRLQPQQALCVYIEKGQESDTSLTDKAKAYLRAAAPEIAIGVVFVDSTEGPEFTGKACNVLFRLVPRVIRTDTARYARSMCPGKCESVPELTLPTNWFASDTLTVDGADDINLSCSMSLFQFLRRYTAPYVREIPLSTLVKELYWRRIQECFEEKHWAKMRKQEVQDNSGGSGIGSSGGNKKKRKKESSSISGGISRRKVESVVVWVGSRSEESQRLVQHQAQTLLGQPFEGHNAVVGWSADDGLYPCRMYSYKCPGGHTGNKKYMGLLPGSAVDAMGAGWSCAQRRPLRALAHLLLLYDPSYIVLVDDDTFVNYPLLVQRFGPALRGVMREQPIVLGELMGRMGDDGHVSKNGFAIGGSGYILGREALNRLQAREVAWLGGHGVPDAHRASSTVSDRKSGGGDDDSDEQRSSKHMQYLSILGESVQILEDPVANCSGGGVATTATATKNDGSGSTGSSCLGPIVPAPRRVHHSPVRRSWGTGMGARQPHLTANSPSADGSSSSSSSSSLGLVVPTSQRLVDLCVSLLSGEHTCQHSDHAMGRCILFGAYASYANVACETLVPLEEVPSHIPVGMCFMAKQCDLRRHVTCHRYRPHGIELAHDNENVIRKVMELAHATPAGAAAASVTGKQKGSRLSRRHRHRDHTMNPDRVNASAPQWREGMYGTFDIDYSGEIGQESLLRLSEFVAGGKAPARKSGQAGHYKVFSSTWDGKITDTHTA